VGHHQLLVLTLLPQLIWVGVQNKKRLWPILMGGLLGIGLTWLGIWLIGSRQHPDSWRIDLSFRGVVNYFLRSDYSGYAMGAGTWLSAYFSKIDWISVWHSWGFYGQRMWEYWGLWNLLGIVGLIWGQKVHPSYWLVLACFAVSGPGLAGYIAVNDPQIVERMYVLSQLYWGLMIGWGVSRLRWQWLWLVLVLVWGGWMLPSRSLSGYVVQQRYVEGLFAGLPLQAGLICLSDASCFGSFYYQSVLGQRTDVRVMANADQFRFGRKTAWEYGGFNYPDNPFRLGEAIGRATLQQQPLYVAQLNEGWE
jgi:hypothetical protein